MHSDTAIRLRATEPEVAQEMEVRTSQAEPSQPIPIDHLYPATEGARPELLKGLKLLADAIGSLENARSQQRSGDDKVADRWIMKFQMILPDLFACRKIGDGYALIINSLHFAMINQKGKPLTLDQMTTIWRVLKEIREKPFLTFDQALAYVTEIEKAYLAVDPPILSELLSDGADEGVRRNNGSDESSSQARV